MFEHTVEKKLQEMLLVTEGRIRSYLSWCESPAARLLLLEFMKIPGAETICCEGEPNSEAVRNYSGGVLESASGLPSVESDDGSYVPAGLVWLESIIRQDVLHDKLRSKCCRLVPKYNVRDVISGDAIGTIDFALFWPRGDGSGHIKIAIELDSNGEHGAPGKINPADSDKYEKLRTNDWVLARFHASQVKKYPGKVIGELRDIAADTNTLLMKERRTA